jgi:hypothetical protein
MTQRTSKLAPAKAALALTFAQLLGCGGSLIPNTDVPDSAENRRIVDFVEQYRLAMEERNPAHILALVSRDYYDDNGTPSTDDDVDYAALQEQLLRLTEDILEVRYEMRYRRVVFRADRVLVDVTYTGRFKTRTAEGERWTRRLADNRLEMVLDGGGAYRILSGL